MERNWLIRTSQNQILGPVAKQKLLEFIQKGALGLTDEVASGNGYWFSLKEKDLVEKYLYGDLPQSYNPISESKSVLSRTEHPEKTTSINSAPANQTQHTQVIKVADIIGNASPKTSDLEFPDVTVVQKAPVLTPALDLSEEAHQKIPDASDLEFPDVAAITSEVSAGFKPAIERPKEEVKEATAPSFKLELKTQESKPSKEASSEEIVFPDEDDLAFPDMDSAPLVLNDKTSTKVEKGKVDLSHQYTRTVALDNEQVSVALPESLESKESGAMKSMREFDEVEGEDIAFSLTLDVPKQAAAQETAPQEMKQPHEVRQVLSKKDKVQGIEERKLLHDRKPKTNNKAAQRDPTRELAHKERDAQLPEPAKKRNDNYIFFILIILALIIVAVFFYFKEILNKPLPV